MRLLRRPHQALASSEQRPQRTAGHGLAIAAKVFFVHRVSDGLSGFRLDCHLRPQQDRGAKAGIDVVVAECFFQNGECRLAGAVNWSDITHAPGIAQRSRYAGDLVVLCGNRCKPPKTRWIGLLMTFFAASTIFSIVG